MRLWLLKALSAMAIAWYCGVIPVDLNAAEQMHVDLLQDFDWQEHHFAMTNWFYKHKWGDPAAQIAILAERGYDGVMLSLKDDPTRWKMLPAYLNAMRDHRIRLVAIHARLYIEDGTYPQVIKDNLPLLKDTKVVLVPSVASRKKMDRKDPRAVAMAVKILHEMADDAKNYGLGGVAPYMHIGNWIETIEDNVRIAKAVKRRNVGVMFHLHHWQAVGNRDLNKLRADLVHARPYLMVVVIQGTDKDKATHRVLGEGSFDMAPLVNMLRELKYKGPLGTMGYTQSGDIPGKLERAFQAWRRVVAGYDYVAIARAYADFMITHGRDVYGQRHTPLFVTGMDRHTGKKISPPFPHVKRKPFMPGWERDRECRGSDRNYGHADALDQLTLLKLMHRLTEITGDTQYAEEADTTAAWWMAHTQTGIGLYPWGTHTFWNVDSEGGGGTFEFNHVWPYWSLNPEALQRYALGLWNHYVRDKETGDFNRHANSNRHAPGGGMEFPWPGSAMICTWAEAYLAAPDPEYIRAITAILDRWEGLRDANGHLAPCSNYQEWAWYQGYMHAANRLDDWADLVEKRQPELAKKMRAYGRTCDAAYLTLADNLLAIMRVGPVTSYLRATGGYDPDRLDILGGPWQDRKHWAGTALLLYGRMKRSDSEALRTRYRQAVLDIAEVYMSINPEVQWAVWGVNMAHAIELLMAAHELTGNAAYLHRADHFGRLAVDLFIDNQSPLPKITSHDDFYEIESVTAPSTDLWMLTVLELAQRLTGLERQSGSPARITPGKDLTALDNGPARSGTPRHIGLAGPAWRRKMENALAEHRAGIWDCTELSAPAASLLLSYGKDDERALFLSRRRGCFEPSKGVPVDQLEVIASDVITKIPTLAEAAPYNGAYRRKFSGKYREISTAVYGGFKDVLDTAGLLLVNHGAKAAHVTVTATFHDSWDDRETEEYSCPLAPGARVFAACAAPDRRFIRRLDIRSNIVGAVNLELFAFEMTPRSKLNPPTQGRAQAAPARLRVAGPPYGNARPRLIPNGLVLQLCGDALRPLADGDQRPVLVQVDGRAVLRFDGKSDFLTMEDRDELDLRAWTLVAVVRAERGPGVIIGKVDGRNAMMNYRLQIQKDGSVGAVVRGASPRQQVNRHAKVNVLNRFAVIAARFDPAAKGADKITIHVDGVSAAYSYQNAEGALDTFTHDRPLEIGRQPGAEPRYFKGDIAGILLYNRSLTEEEEHSAALWLLNRK